MINFNALAALSCRMINIINQAKKNYKQKKLKRHVCKMDQGNLGLLNLGLKSLVFKILRFWDCRQNISLSLPVFKTAVERAFTCHGLVYLNLWSCLSCSMLDEELFISYNITCL